MKSLHSFCKEHGLPKTSVKRFLNDEGFDTSEGLNDEAIAAALAEFVPMVPVVEAEPDTTVETSIVRTESRANPLMPIHIENLTVNVTAANTRQLSEETNEFQQVTAQGLSAIGQYLQADLVSAVQATAAQNRHAVAGLNAAAAVGLANSLGKPQAPQPGDAA
ncbi:MAG: hypothetical protein AAGF98_10270 [Cyanobacteria bacterium P01_H01_bin.153]